MEVTSTRSCTLGTLALVGSLLASGALAPASADAQTVLPRPDPPFKGHIGRTYQDSTPDQFPLIKAPPGAPNVLLVLIDDTGYGAWSTFGGQVATPNVDRIADMGLRYTRFHTTALCSPTRAALITGRNHHSVGTGVITEMGTAYPGYTGQIPKSAATIAEIVRQNGYSTLWIGKNHNVPDWETSISGPFDRWPTLQGFDHFYGFVAAETNQWAPLLYRGHERVEMVVPKGREGSYTLNDSLADETIRYIYEQKSVTPDRPLFIYYAPGATHAPHHAPKDWLARFKGQFDQGWDVYRQQTFERQLRLGVIPKGSKLTPRPPEIPAYDSLTPDQKKIAARLMEAFAAYTAQTDYEIGRILDALEQVDQLHNTLVFCILGDNGASMEGGVRGSFNELASLAGDDPPPELILQHLDEIGGPKAYNHFPVGWAWAMNTPFQWGKQVASHFGGMRNPLVVAWPDRIKAKGETRAQFHHVIDIAPTILEAAGIPEPTEVNGVRQKPIEGVSMLYSFDDPNAAGRRSVQYFELLGNRALYQDGWIASVRHGRLPWVTGLGSTTPFDQEKWELYDLTNDYSQYENVAAKHPEKLAALEKEFWVQAQKHQVLPLDDRLTERVNPALRPSLAQGRTIFTYYDQARLPDSAAAPATQNRSNTITAYVDVPKGGAEGVLVAAGGVAGGFSLFVKDGRPIYEYNFDGLRRVQFVGDTALSPGANVVRMQFRYEGGGLGKAADVTLLVNDRPVAHGTLPRTVWVGKYSTDETFDIGLDSGSPASNDYASPFDFTGTLHKVVVDASPANLTAADRERIQAVQQELRRGTE
jgi:arylsulfatase A-like enzyme